MHPCDVRIGEYRYNSVEQYYQSMKTESPDEAREIRACYVDPSTAKKLGQKLKSIKSNWNDIRVSVMTEGVRAKFTQNPDLAEKLLATGDMALEEGNTWGDLFWGVDYHTREGENRLGRILMQVREELRRNRDQMPKGGKIRTRRLFMVSSTSGDGCTVIFDKDTDYPGMELILPGISLSENSYRVEEESIKWYYPDNDIVIDETAKKELIEVVRDEGGSQGITFEFSPNLEGRQDFPIHGMSRQMFDNEASFYLRAGFHHATIIFNKNTEYARGRLCLDGEAMIGKPRGLWMAKMGWTWPLFWPLDEMKMRGLIENICEEQGYKLYF
ncbi:MAG: NADAR family protein [Planctomycetes bacterium]|nr:NADAR family protein [Planctomycetota bacterium]